MEFIAFDIETAETWSEDKPFDYTQMGIACAATLSGDRLTFWHDGYGPRMIPDQCVSLLTYLEAEVREGKTLIAWNGNFDMRILAHECGTDEARRRCAKLALGMIDPMFQFLTMEGYCISLEKVAQAFGVGEKVGMHGADAPTLWKESREQQERVLEYVAGDVALTMKVVQKIAEYKAILRYTTYGNLRRTVVDDLYTVGKCLQIPQADTPWWADNPWRVGSEGDRRSFVAWMGLDTDALL